MITVQAPAKLNLTLEVRGKRPDGYHETASVMQTVTLYDTLSATHDDSLSIECNISTLAAADNLALRAAALVRQAYGVTTGAALTLEKGIPVAAGLGGGSSDAAAALRCVDRLWGLSLSFDELLALAQPLGADVPFFLQGGTALVEGRGGRITPLPAIPTAWFVLLCPPTSLPQKTATLYRALCSTHFSGGERSAHLTKLLRQGGLLSSEMLYNTFESMAFESFPGLTEERERFLQAGARSVHLTGTGPTLFTLVSGPEEGRALVAGLSHQGRQCLLVQSVSAAELRWSEESQDSRGSGSL